jgi:hypothetical protein
VFRFTTALFIALVVAIVLANVADAGPYRIGGSCPNCPSCPGGQCQAPAPTVIVQPTPSQTPPTVVVQPAPAPAIVAPAPAVEVRVGLIGWVFGRGRHRYH